MRATLGVIDTVAMQATIDARLAEERRVWFCVGFAVCSVVAGVVAYLCAS